MMTDIENQHKVVAKQRKKANKKFKTMDNSQDLNEQLGANEEEGIRNAEEQKDSQLQAARDAKKNLLQMHDGSALGSGPAGMSGLSANKSQIAS